MSLSRSGDQVPAAPSPGHRGMPKRSAAAEGRPGDQLGKAPAGAPRAGFALLLTLSMAQFMVVLDFTIVNVALPSIQHGLHVATTTLQWLISGYAVAFGGFLLLGGRLADVYGRARLYRIGLVVFVVASIAGGLAVEPGLLIASRVVQGIGAAMLAPAGLSLLVTSYPDQQERSHALGIYGAIVSTGFARGAVLGGLLAEVTWRLVFFVNAPVGVALLIASFRLLPPDPPSSKGQLDVPGAITVTAGVALLVFAVARAGDTLKVIQPALLFGAAVVLLGAFAVRESRSRAPILDLALLKDRGILGANLALIAVGAFSAGQVMLVSLYPAGGAGAQSAADRPVLRPAGGGSIRAGRAGGSSPRSGRGGRWPPGCPSRCWPWPETPSRCWPDRCPRCWRARSCSGSPTASARSRPPWPAPRGRSPPGPRARPAPC